MVPFLSPDQSTNATSLSATNLDLQGLRLDLIDPDPAVRGFACESLASFRLKEVVQDLIVRLSDVEPEVRVVAAGALTELAELATESQPALLSLLECTDHYLSWYAARTLFAIGCRSAELIEPLAEGLLSADPAERFEAVSLLGQIEGDLSSIVPRLATLVRDECPRVQQAAIEILRATDPTALAEVRKIGIRAYRKRGAGQVPRGRVDLSELFGCPQPG